MYHYLPFTDYAVSDSTFYTFCTTLFKCIWWLFIPHIILRSLSILNTRAYGNLLFMVLCFYYILIRFEPDFTTLLFVYSLPHIFPFKFGLQQSIFLGWFSKTCLPVPQIKSFHVRTSFLNKEKFYSSIYLHEFYIYLHYILQFCPYCNLYYITHVTVVSL